MNKKKPTGRKRLTGEEPRRLSEHEDFREYAVIPHAEALEKKFKAEGTECPSLEMIARLLATGGELYRDLDDWYAEKVTGPDYWDKEIIAAMKKHKGNKTKAAKELGMSRTGTLPERLAKIPDWEKKIE